MDAQNALSALVEAVADGHDPDFSSIDASGLDEDARARLASLHAVCQIRQCFATLASGSYSTVVVGPQPTVSSDRVGPAAWGPLQMRERVGRGRFGDVYRAWDPAIDRPVALKLLRRLMAESPSDSVVVHEARLMARVRHPNVVTIYGAAHHDGQTGLWMEYIEGRTLEAELRESGPFQPTEVARIGVELCRALDAVHGAGLVHRDVKAQNVMREARGRLVLGDFGTGLDIGDGAQESALAGTPVYLAPEIYRGAAATPQSDIYSLGVLLFHLATDSFPVVGRSVADIRRAHERAERRQTFDVRPDMPVALAEVITRALSAAPAERYQSAADMERALLRIVAPAPSDSDTRRRGLPSVIWLAAAALLVSLGAVLITRGWPLPVSVRDGQARQTAALLTGLSEERRLLRIPAPTNMRFWGQPSPDGRHYSYVDADGEVGWFDTTSGERHRLTDVGGEGGFVFHTSTFSPDGRDIAYAMETPQGTRELRIVPVAGGVSRAVLRSVDRIPHPLDWSSDRQRLLCLFERLDGERSLIVVSLTTGDLQFVATVDAGHSTAKFSPDGRYVAFDQLQSADALQRDVLIASIDPPAAPRPLISAAADDFGPLWSPDGRQLTFISDRTGEPSVWSVAVSGDVATSQPAILHRNIGRVTPYGLSRDGTLFYTLLVGLVDVYRGTFDLLRDPAVADAEPVAPTQLGSKMNSDWSRDGRYLVYVSLPHAGIGSASSRRLSVLDITTGAVSLLNPALSYYAFPQWSPDGQTILVKGSDLQSRRGVFVIHASSGVVERVLAVDDEAPHEIGAITWGTDAHTILYTRDSVGLFAFDRRTRVERRLLAYRDEGITTFTPNPGFRLSRDGDALAYSAYRKSSSGRNETVLRVKHGEAPTRDLVIGNVRIEDWAVDGHVLYTQFLPGTNRTSLWRVAATGGTPRALGFEAAGLRNVVVHPDGRQVTFTSGFPGNEVWALDNFLPRQ